MSRLTKILLVVVVAALGAAVAFLATWDIPAPSEEVKREIDDGRFPR